MYVGFVGIGVVIGVVSGIVVDVVVGGVSDVFVVFAAFHGVAMVGRVYVGRVCVWCVVNVDIAVLVL